MNERKIFKARELLGDDVINLTDKQLFDFVCQVEEMVSIGFDCYEKNRFGKVISLDNHFKKFQ